MLSIRFPCKPKYLHMKKLSPIAYRSLFFKHVWRFIQNVSTPAELNRSHAVAVSGGLDSMTLLWFANSLYKQGKIGPVRALFVNHQTREGQKGDQALVEKFCQQENIPLKVLNVTGLSNLQSNFEARARKIRRDLCLAERNKGELLWVGHHLDDSYEWNFMQRNRSTNAKASIGIPVRNRCIIRPFLCATRAQIKHLSIFEAIPYQDDPTNFDLKHDRNFVRHKIIPHIKKRYPKYLKFYAHFANFSAFKLNVNIMGRSDYSKIYAFEQGAVLTGRNFSDIQIQEILHTYSHADRGKLITPIEKMLRAIDNGKKGPFHFSGRMEAYYSYGLLMIYQQGMKNYDESIAKVLHSLSEKELLNMPTYKLVELKHSWQNLMTTSDAMLNMPGLVLVLESESVCKTMNTSVFDPLFPKVSEVCKARGLRFSSFQKCCEVWSQKSEKLPERLRLLPLANLSNLFTFQ
jgi:tRNA(Ile)-lysidine synthase